MKWTNKKKSNGEKMSKRGSENHRWSLEGDLANLPARNRSRKRTEKASISEVSSEEFAPSWHWGNELKETGIMTPKTGGYLLDFSFEQLGMEEDQTTISLLSLCQVYGPFLASTFRMQVGSHDASPLAKCE